MDKETKKVVIHSTSAIKSVGSNNVHDYRNVLANIANELFALNDNHKDKNVVCLTAYLVNNKPSNTNPYKIDDVNSNNIISNLTALFDIEQEILFETQQVNRQLQNSMLNNKLAIVVFMPSSNNDIDILMEIYNSENNYICEYSSCFNINNNTGFTYYVNDINGIKYLKNIANEVLNDHIDNKNNSLKQKRKNNNKNNYDISL